MAQQHLIRGYHGTTVPRAQNIVATRQIRISTNDYDWLGQGAYFFQDAPLRAWKWACEWVAPRAGESPAVVSADITLEDCLDFLDLLNWRHLLSAHQLIVRAPGTPTQNPPVVRAASGQRFRIMSPVPPAARTGYNTLDCAVVKLAVSVRRRHKRVPSVRGSFVEGQQLYDDSYFFDHSHVQIAVLEPDVIVPNSYAIEDDNALAHAYQMSGMTRWPV
jgi:hypothetical protein